MSVSRKSEVQTPARCLVIPFKNRVTNFLSWLHPLCSYLQISKIQGLQTVLMGCKFCLVFTLLSS